MMITPGGSPALQSLLGGTKRPSSADGTLPPELEQGFLALLGAAVRPPVTPPAVPASIKAGDGSADGTDSGQGSSASAAATADGAAIDANQEIELPNWNRPLVVAFPAAAGSTESMPTNGAGDTQPLTAATAGKQVVIESAEPGRGKVNPGCVMPSIPNGQSEPAVAEPVEPGRGNVSPGCVMPSIPTSRGKPMLAPASSSDTSETASTVTIPPPGGQVPAWVAQQSTPRDAGVPTAVASRPTVAESRSDSITANSSQSARPVAQGWRGGVAEQTAFTADRGDNRDDAPAADEGAEQGSHRSTVSAAAGLAAEVVVRELLVGDHSASASSIPSGGVTPTTPHVNSTVTDAVPTSALQPPAAVTPDQVAAPRVIARPVDLAVMSGGESIKDPSAASQHDHLTSGKEQAKNSTARQPASESVDPKSPDSTPARTDAAPSLPHLAAQAASGPGPQPTVTASVSTTPDQPVHARPDATPIKTGTDRVTVTLPDANGGSTTVRIAVRGDQVRASIVSSDAITADQLSSQAPELERALVDRGFRATDISVSRSSDTPPPAVNGNQGSLAAASLSGSAGEAWQSTNRHADGSAGESRQGSADRDRESPDRKAEDQPRQGRPHQRPRHGRGR